MNCLSNKKLQNLERDFEVIEDYDILWSKTKGVLCSFFDQGVTGSEITGIIHDAFVNNNKAVDFPAFVRIVIDCFILIRDEAQSFGGDIGRTEYNIAQFMIEQWGMKY